MRRLGLEVGDNVELDGRTMHVVGEVFTPEVGHTGYDEGGRVSPGEARRRSCAAVTR